MQAPERVVLSHAADRLPVSNPVLMIRGNPRWRASLGGLLERERQRDQLRLAARRAREADAKRRRLGLESRGNAFVPVPAGTGSRANGTVTVG